MKQKNLTMKKKKKIHVSYFHRMTYPMCQHGIPNKLSIYIDIRFINALEYQKTNMKKKA